MIVGAGMVGAACALYMARAGLDVALLDRGPVAAGTTGAGEGDLLVSDKGPGPELDLALLSGRLWADLGEELGEAVEYEAKGGVVVAATPEGLTALETFAAGQRAAGVEAVPVAADQLHSLEPHLAPGLAGAVHYPQDTQVMPALAAAHLVRASGARLLTGRTVTEVLRGADGAVRGVRTDRGDVHAPAVVNAAGTWGAAVAGLAGVFLPVLPRRGFVLVTEPLPRRVRHKVYAADRPMPATRSSAPSAAPAALPSLGGKKRSYREPVADALRAALIAGELRAGEVYSAPTLAARFGVSATPVREAMLDLAKEGLVDTVPNKGFRVTAVSEKQLDEYTHIRSLIEIPTTVQLATTADPVSLEALRPAAREIVTAAAAGDLIAYVEADIRFHLGLLALAGNAHLVEVVGDLRERSLLYGLNALVEAGRLQDSAEEHLELLDALMDRDPEAVRRVMTRHLGHVRGLWAAH
ncbi:FAD-dependent oxidoreductase [Streptomyces sp. NBC_01728]|nr:FAD-dependent oxidoreductase [Streptomyces sp. NBC_01719]MCX4497786.1 FAD-dependent oxidoreductase [Streptomyces sp. NBC_01728]